MHEMEINLPAIVAEVHAIFERYERALLANDIDTLNELFLDHPLTVRFGVGENLYGHEEIAQFRYSRRTGPFTRTLSNTRIVTVGKNFAVASTEYQRAGEARPGRESKTLIRTEQGWRILAAHVSLIGVTV